MLDFLFVNWNVNPEIFHIGSVSIRWYSILFVAGFVLGWFIFKWFFKREGVPVQLLDPLLYTSGTASSISLTIISAAGKASGRYSCRGRAVWPAMVVQ